MHKNVKWIIGSGLATTFIVAAGLAIAVEKHEGHHNEARAETWHIGKGYMGKGHISKGHKSRHHMRFGKAEMKLETLQASLSNRFLALDADGNGMISPDEFSAKAIERFMKIDVDGDGILTRAEIKQAHKSQKENQKQTAQDSAAAS